MTNTNHKENCAYVTGRTAGNPYCTCHHLSEVKESCEKCFHVHIEKLLKAERDKCFQEFVGACLTKDNVKNIQENTRQEVLAEVREKMPKELHSTKKTGYWDEYNEGYNRAVRDLSEIIKALEA